MYYVICIHIHVYIYNLGAITLPCYTEMNEYHGSGCGNKVSLSCKIIILRSS